MADCCSMEILGWLVAIFIGTKSVYNICHFVYTTWLGHLLGHSIDLRKCGPWAVVTGATDGIGKAFAKQMAAAGLNVMLISRTPAKLKAVAEEIKAQYSSIEIKTVAVDFTEGQSIYPKLRTELNQIQIGILVNNVGMFIGFDQFGNLEDDRELHNIINCNVLSMTRMCHIVLPQMLKRKTGVVINIGSLSSAVPTPLLTVYGATKSYVEKFSRDLYAEVKDQGITVQTIHPGYVYTNMASHTKPSLITPGPDTFVASTLRSLGLEDRTSGFWFHKILLYFSELIGFFIPRSVMEKQIIKELSRVGAIEKQNKTKKSR